MVNRIGRRRRVCNVGRVGCRCNQLIRNVFVDVECRDVDAESWPRNLIGCSY